MAQKIMLAVAALLLAGFAVWAVRKDRRHF
jgi:hypothetical protein